MSDSQKQMLGKLDRLQGTDFTEQYHSDQVSAHNDVVDLFKRYGDSGSIERLILVFGHFIEVVRPNPLRSICFNATYKVELPQSSNL